MVFFESQQNSRLGVVYMTNCLRFAPAFLFLAICSKAEAGSFADSLASCMMSHMSPAENSLFIRWVFGALAAHPDVSSLAGVSDATYEPVAQAFASSVEGLLTTQCRTEAIAALKQEGRVSILTAFQRVSQSSARLLMSNQRVVERLQAYGKYLSKDRLDDLGSEAVGKRPLPQNTAPAPGH